jgi:hypothetical protein
VNPKTTNGSLLKKYFGLRPILILLVSVLLVSVLIFKLHKHPNLNDVDVIMKDVSRHYTLPTKETPALATVTNSQKVQSSFAGKVQNGDKILIYQQNKLAVVYRPSIDRVVDVQPVSIDTPPSAQTVK